MTDHEKKYLSDILNAIELIESFISGILSFEEYNKNYLEPLKEGINSKLKK